MLKQCIIASCLATTVLFTGCQTMNNDQSSSTATVNVLKLENRTWITTQIGHTAIPSTATQVPRLQFDSATKRVSGTDSCNRIMGSYETKEDQLSLSQMAGTKMACLNNGNIDQAFNSALSKVTHYQIFNQHLKLLDRHGNVLIQLENMVQPR